MMCFVDDSNDTSPFVIRSVARRKTDLIPTIPIRDSNFGSRTSLYCSTPRTQGKPQLTHTHKQNPFTFTLPSLLSLPPSLSPHSAVLFFICLFYSCCFCRSLSLSFLLSLALSHSFSMVLCIECYLRKYQAFNADVYKVFNKCCLNVSIGYSSLLYHFSFKHRLFFSLSSFFIWSISIVSTFHNLSFDISFH